MLDLNQIIDRMCANAHAIARLARDLSDAQTRLKPAADAWSLREVVNHRYGEECVDFRTHLDYILHRPTKEQA